MSWAFGNCKKVTEINFNAIDARSKDLILNDTLFWNVGLDADGVTINIGEEVESFIFYNALVYVHNENRYHPQSNITEINFHENCKIKTFGIYNCSSLTQLTLPDSVTTLAAFSFCGGLTSFEIPDGVTSIVSEAFRDCTSLTSITIPDSVTEIGLWAFYNCGELELIKFNGTVEQWNAIDKDPNWDFNFANYTVKCSDGTLYIEGENV